MENEKIKRLEENLKTLKYLEKDCPELLNIYRPNLTKYYKMLELFDFDFFVYQYSRSENFRYDTWIYDIVSVAGYPSYRDADKLVELVTKINDYTYIEIKPVENDKSIELINTKTNMKIRCSYTSLNSLIHDIDSVIEILLNIDSEIYKFLYENMIYKNNDSFKLLLFMINHLDMVNIMPYLFVDDCHRIKYPKGLQIRSIFFIMILDILNLQYSYKTLDIFIREKCREHDFLELVDIILIEFPIVEHMQKYIDEYISMITIDNKVFINKQETITSLSKLVDNKDSLVVSDNNGISYIPNLNIIV